MINHTNNLQHLATHITIRDDLNDASKKRRGRPKGSKNKPKEETNNNNIINNNLPVAPFTYKQLPEQQQLRLKSSRKAAKKTSDNLFIIKPKPGAKCYYQTEVTVDYTPNRDYDQVKSIVPHLNADNLPYIPGFIMEMDETYYHKHDQRYKEEHQNKIVDYTKAKRGLFQPKPGKRHNYCCVCKQSYDDYLSHVTSQAHKKAYISNDFAKYIKSMSGQYNQWSRQQSLKDDLIEYTPETQTHVDNQDDCQIIPAADSSHTHKCGGFKDKISYEKHMFLRLQQRDDQLLSRNMPATQLTNTGFQSMNVFRSNNNPTNYMDIPQQLRQQSATTAAQQQSFLGSKSTSNPSATTMPTQLIHSYHFDAQFAQQAQMLSHPPHYALHSAFLPTATATPAYYMNIGMTAAAALTGMKSNGSNNNCSVPASQQNEQEHEDGLVMRQQNQIGFSTNSSNNNNSLNAKRKADPQQGCYQQILETQRKLGVLTTPGGAVENVIDLTEKEFQQKTLQQQHQQSYQQPQQMHHLTDLKNANTNVLLAENMMYRVSNAFMI